MAHFAFEIERQDISSAHRVPVRTQTADRTDVNPSPRFVLVLASWAGARRIRLILQLDLDPKLLHLVREIRPHLAVRPLADLLLALAVQPLAIAHVTHIAEGGCSRLALAHPLGSHTADLVLDVSLLPPRLGQQLVLCALQSPPGAAALHLGCLLVLDLGQLLVAPLLDGSQLSRGDDERFFPVGESKRVDLARIDRDNPVARRILWLLAILDRHVPLVPARPVVHQLDLAERVGWQIAQPSWQSDLDGRIPPGKGQQERIVVLADGRVLPHCGPEPLAFVGILIVQALLAAFARRLAGVVETFASSIQAVGVQKGRRSKLSILQLAGCFPAQPVAMASVDAPVTHERVGVYLPALGIESVSQRASDVSAEVVDTYHTKTIAQTFCKRKLNRRQTQHALVPRLEVGGLRAI
jgi:hypothetical protein